MRFDGSLDTHQTCQRRAKRKIDLWEVSRDSSGDMVFLVRTHRIPVKIAGMPEAKSKSLNIQGTNSATASKTKVEAINDELRARKTEGKQGIRTGKEKTQEPGMTWAEFGSIRSQRGQNLVSFAFAAKENQEYRTNPGKDPTGREI